jgi:hypothetical protein
VLGLLAQGQGQKGLLHLLVVLLLNCQAQEHAALPGVVAAAAPLALQEYLQVGSLALQLVVPADPLEL